MDPTYSKLQLPGFRFHPTEEELLDYYLKKMVSVKKLYCDIIGYLNIYLYDPWVLPGLSKIGEREWYFFVPRDRKHGSGGRPNRTTQNGFWKATGSDRKIVSLSDPKKHLGLKKTLVFYKGRAPRGSKTDWVMNEYRLPDNNPLSKDIVLCKIYRKATSMKVLEQRATTQEENKTLRVSPEKTISFSAQSDDQTPPMLPRATPIESCQVAFDNTGEFDQKPLLFLDDIFKDSFESSNVTLDNHNELHHDQWHNAIGAVWDQNSDIVSSATSSNIVSDDNSNTNKVSSLRLSIGDVMLHELELPKSNTDWTQDSFWTQLCSPWLENLMLTSPYANILNF